MKRNIFFIIFLLSIIGSTAVRADDRDTVASLFHVDSKYLVMNLPPKPDRWPGAIFTNDLRFVIKYGTKSDPDLHRGDAVMASSNDSFNLGANVAGGNSWIGISADAGDVGEVKVYFPDARVIEMSRDDLVKHIAQSPSAIADVKDGKTPIVIIRAFAGTPTIVVSKKATASVSAWDRFLSTFQIQGAIKGDKDNSVTYSGKDEFVFAFETAEVHYGSGTGAGSDAIAIINLPEQLYKARENAVSAKINNNFSRGFSICIGDICNSSAADVKFDCNFAYAHPSDTDEVATKTACIVQNDFAAYRFTRTLSVGGGRCGEIVLNARCIE
jgi:hypothetical protein